MLGKFVPGEPLAERLLPMNRFIRLAAALLVLLGSSAGAQAGEAYYLLMFGSQTTPPNPNYSHSFATFVRATWPGPEPCPTNPTLEAVTISFPLLIERDLHERAVGVLRGKTHAEAEAVWRETVMRWRAGDITFAPPGAESFFDVQRRSVPILRRLASEYDGRTIIIIAHGHVCRVLLLSLLPEKSSADWDGLGAIRNLAITELSVTGEAWQLVRLNEVPAAVEAVSDVE